MGQMLTAKQVAEVKGCSGRYIKRLIQEGKLQAQEVLNDKNRKTYLVPLEALDEELQQKWYQMNLENPSEEISTPEPVPDKKAVDHFSESERQEIDFWISLVEQWQQYRMKPGVTCKADVDKKFVTLCGLEYPDKEISVDILYRKWKAVKENDLDGLIDKRGKWKKGTSSIDDTIWQAFLYFYLDESQHPIQKCLDYTKMWAQEKRPDLYTDIPSYSAFYRRLNNEVPEGVKVLGREGHKAYNDRCAPFIRRIYEDIESNEWWIADNHTFDVMVKDKNGNIHRPYLTAFLDARSGIFTGFHITYNPCSEATLIALRKGILKYGIPDNIYVDNGREFLTFDIGGLGHRKKKPKDGEEKFEPPGVFKRLGINMTNAIVRNAKAKIIERRFEDVKNDLSRLFNTYTGGSVVEKPERLKFVLKKEQIYTDEEFEEYVTAVLEWYFNMEAYNGAVEADKGKCKMDVFNEHLKRKRVASAEELNLMLMRNGSKHLLLPADPRLHCQRVQFQKCLGIPFSFLQVFFNPLFPSGIFTSGQQLGSLCIRQTILRGIFLKHRIDFRFKRPCCFIKEKHYLFYGLVCNLCIIENPLLGSLNPLVTFLLAHPLPPPFCQLHPEKPW